MIRSIAVLCALLLISAQWPAHALQLPPPPPGPPPPGAYAPGAPPATPLLAPQQLDDLVAPIALYPDPLIAQILAAATYPLEAVQADRWLQANGGLRGTALTDAAQAQPWDPSVQALVVFPAVLSMMDNNLQWTINLGNAVLGQEQDVMDAIQRQRQRAMAAGRLASSPQQVVQQTTDTGQPVIAIEPAQPETMYVPVYDPVAVWGPPVYHPWPAFWYPPRPAGAVIATGFLGFFVGVTVAPYFRQWGGWGGWGWGAGWRTHTVVVNNNFYVRNNYRPPSNFVRNGQSTWSHDPQHRGDVAYPAPRVAERVGAPAARVPRSPVGPAMTPRPEVRQPAPQVRSTSRPDRDHTVFGGSSSAGSRARVESDRGHASLGNRSVPRPAPAPQARPAARPAQGRPGERR